MRVFIFAFIVLLAACNGDGRNPTKAEGTSKSVAEGGLPSLIWYKMDDPPDFIIEGPDKGQGVQDLAMAWFQERLPAYRHTEEFSIIARLINNLKKGVAGTTLGLYRSEERRSFMLFSKRPSGVFFPVSLIIPDRLKELPVFKPPVDLAKLVLDDRFRGGAWPWAALTATR
jgi:uncharacterized protein (TIGR02285 family)